MSNPVLVLFAHPALERSRVNAALVSAVQDLPGVTFHDLYESYPDFDVDVTHEQDLLTEHDTIVLQHPLFWYSTPALVKQWEDLVLEHGWAYGSEGTALAGKRVVSVVTTGAAESVYQADRGLGVTLPQLLRPLEQTFRLCGMDYLPPFLVYGSLALTDEEIAAHAREYRRAVEALRDGALDLEAAREHARLNWRRPPSEPTAGGDT